MTGNIYTGFIKIPEQVHSCILATVISSGGSTPQVPGSSALFSKNGLVSGTVGGGPAEYKVMLKSFEAIKTGKSEIITFDMAGQLQLGSDSICGGNMMVLLDAEPHKHFTVFSQMNNSLSGHVPGVLVTLIEENPDKNLFISRFWYDISHSHISGEIPPVAGNEIREILSAASNSNFRFIPVPSEMPGSSAWVCLERITPPPSLVIAGAGHVGKALARMGKFLGFEVTVWDDRSDFANAVHIPEADNHFSGPFSEFSSKIRIDGNSWLVIVTRGHQYDAEVLRSWIRTAPAYLGMMGSRSKIAQMRQQFLEKGWATEEEWNRVHTPVGLKIGAKTVEEIAVSIAAELIQVRYGVSQGYPA